MSASLPPGPDPTLGTKVYYTALKKKKWNMPFFILKTAPEKNNVIIKENNYYYPMLKKKKKTSL